MKTHMKIYQRYRGVLSVLMLLGGMIALSCSKKKTDIRCVLKITSKPKGAFVAVDTVKLKHKTPVKVTIWPGTHIVKISKEKYMDVYKKVYCSKKGKETVSVKLAPVTASVLIKSVPPGANVEINGQIVGETPLLLYDQPIGKYSALLKKPTYSIKEIEWEITDERPVLVTANLTSKIGILDIKSTPSSADIFVDDVPRGKTPFRIQVEEGKHKIRVSLKGYTTFQDIVFVERNATKNINAVLQLLPGAIRIVSNPPGAMVYLNNRQYGITPLTIDHLTKGDYTLKLTKSGYDSVTKKVTVYPGQTVKEEVKLDTNLGGIDLIVNPPGVTIYVDGRRLGLSQKGETKNISRVFPIRGLTSGRHRVMLAHKRATPSKIKFNVFVRKGEITRIMKNMWIADTILILKNGTRIKGRIRSKNDEEIMFENSPRIRQSYKRNEIKALIPLTYKDE